VAPLSLHASGISAVNSVVMGLVVSVIAVLSLRATPGNHLPAWINLAAGFWVFFSPWALNINGQTPVLVKSAITGALIIIFALARTTAGRPASV
jgi:SPW repeat-containing protein